MDTIEELNKLMKYKGKEICWLIDTDGEFWFHGKDVAGALGYNTDISIKNSLQNHVSSENKCNYGKLKLSIQNDNKVKYDSRNIFINKKGIIDFLSSSQAYNIKEGIIFFCEKLNISYEIIYRTKMEHDCINAICIAFSHLNLVKQYKVLNHRIDLYFVDYKLAIKCDEHDHQGYKNDKEREDNIIKELNCYFIRFNPHAKDFNLFKVINQILIFMK